MTDRSPGNSMIGGRLETPLKETMTALIVTIRNYVDQRRLEIDERGATAVEYALMVGLIAVGIITAVVALKTKVATTFQKVGNAVGT